MKINKKIIQNILEKKIREELLNEAFDNERFMSQNSSLSHLVMKEEDQKEFLELLRAAGRGKSDGTANVYNKDRKSVNLDYQTPEDVQIMSGFKVRAPLYLKSISGGMENDTPLNKNPATQYFEKNYIKATPEFKKTIFGRLIQEWYSIAKQFESSSDQNLRNELYSRIKNDNNFIASAINYDKFEPDIHSLPPKTTPNQPAPGLNQPGPNQPAPGLNQPGPNQPSPNQPAPGPQPQKKKVVPPTAGAKRGAPKVAIWFNQLSGPITRKELEKRWVTKLSINNLLRGTILYLQSLDYIKAFRDQNGDLAFIITPQGKKYAERFKP